MRANSIPAITSCDKAHLLSISADVTTNEFRTTDSKLSVWRIDSIQDLDKAALAISLGGQRIESIKVVILDMDAIEDFFQLDKSKGLTVATGLVNIHRDICGITHSSLEKLLFAYKNAVDSSNWKQYGAKQLKELIKTALLANQVDIESAPPELAEQLKSLQSA